MGRARESGVETLIRLAPDVDSDEAVAMVGTGRTALAVLEEANLDHDDVVVVTAARPAASAACSCTPHDVLER